ncbi:ATP-binding cassette domain-containing protein [Anaerolineales bacterium]
MQPDNAIELQSVTKFYGEFKAVDELTFNVQFGEIFALLGPNGAGKSTTIRMLLDIIRPTKGKIQILGGKLDSDRKDRIGYLPEERGLYKDVSVIDVMVYLGCLKGMKAAAARQRSEELLKRLDLAENMDHKVRELSKGMQQKVQFAVTVLHRPDLIIIDEPFTGLDPVNRMVIRDLLLDFKKQGGAIVMSTHQMNQVEELADRLVMINHGQRKLYGDVMSIRQEHAQHAIIVEGQGDWASVAGVIEVQDKEREGTFLLLDPEVTADQVLVNIANDPNITIHRYELAIPDLNSIFIQVAGETS